MSLLRALVDGVYVQYQDGSRERQLSVGETVPEDRISPLEVKAYIDRKEMVRVEAEPAEEKPIGEPVEEPEPTSGKGKAKS